jgi:membrane protease YdiL (CAAX protease family)
MKQELSTYTLGSVLNLYADVWEFAKKPTSTVPIAKWGPVFIFVLAALFVLDAAVAIGAWYFEGAIAAGTGHTFPQPIDQGMSLSEDLITGVILAPILEEAFFRGWLNGKLAALRFAAVAGLAVVLVVAGSFMGAQSYAIIFAISLIILVLGLAQWLATRKVDTQVPEWFSAHFGKFVWGSAIVFGLTHLGNFEDFSSPIDVIVVMSQTLGGLVLAYTRTRLGLGAAMAQHAVFNFFVLIEPG